MYKDLRTCECGYTTIYRGNMSNHKKHHCRERIITANPVENELRERVASLEAQVAADREQLAAKDAQMKEQLEAKDRQIDQRGAPRNCRSR